MNHGWPQGTPAGGPGTGEPYPGFARTHEHYYQRQLQRLQEDRAAPPDPAAAPSFRDVMNPNAFPGARPDLNPEQQALYDGFAEMKRQKLMRMYIVLAAVIFLVVVLPIIRLLT